MKKLIFFCTIQLILANTFGQTNHFKKNSLSLEIGAYHRGALGLSYSRNFFLNDDGFFAAEFSAGIESSPYNHLNKYYCVSPVLYIGKSTFKLIIGADLKYYDIVPSDGKIHLIKGPQPGPNYVGFTACPLLGISVFFKSGAVFRHKFTLNPIIQNGKTVRTILGTGFTIGHSF